MRSFNGSIRWPVEVFMSRRFALLSSILVLMGKHFRNIHTESPVQKGLISLSTLTLKELTWREVKGKLRMVRAGRTQALAWRDHMKSCTAFAPSSTANLGPGYDVFGLALDPLKDKVQIVKGAGRSRKVEITMLGEQSESVPSEAESNSAGLVIKKMAEVFDIENDLRVTVVKGVPVGSGMGSSGASAAAAAMAFNRLFDLGMRKSDLVKFAVEGELASAGAKHYDNVSPSLLGGFVIVRTSPELRFIRVSPPRDLVLVVAFPMMDVPRKKTEFARGVLPEQVPLESVVHNVSNASTIVAGVFSGDVEMIAQGVHDIIVEPARKHLIPGYEAVRRRAIDAGALAVTISGAGPSMVSFLKTGKNGKRIAQAMAEGFKEAKLESRTFVCRPSAGARVIK